MPPTIPLTADRARELLRKNATLTTQFAELGARGTAAAAALARPGTPPSDDLVHALGAAGRELTALRTEAFAVAATLGLKTPPAETIDSTKKLEAMLRLLLDGLEQAERQAAAARARAGALAILDRVAALAHRDDPGFAALAACHKRAADARTTLSTATEIGPDAIAPFEALLTLIDGQHQLDDEQWGKLEDAVATAFGRSLAVAASRGNLVAR
jgi:hypothetical protein